MGIPVFSFSSSFTHDLNQKLPVNNVMVMNSTVIEHNTILGLKVWP